jgi:hypothetical protein
MVKQIVLKLVLLPVMLGAATLLFMPAVSAAGGGTVTCTTYLTGPVDANLDVPAGQTCFNFGFEITGNVTVEGRLGSANGTYDKNIIVADGGSVFFDLCRGLLCPRPGGNHVAGNFSITGSPSNNLIDGTGVQKNLIVEGNSGQVVVDEAGILGNVNIDGNSGPVFIAATIGGNLNCDGNATAPILAGVSVSKATGQCAA